MPDKREIPEDAVVVVPVDLFRDIMIVVAGTGRDRELWDKLYDLRWSVPKHSLTAQLQHWGRHDLATRVTSGYRTDCRRAA